MRNEKYLANSIFEQPLAVNLLTLNAKQNIKAIKILVSVFNF